MMKVRIAQENVFQRTGSYLMSIGGECEEGPITDGPSYTLHFWRNQALGDRRDAPGSIKSGLGAG
jgi:hypothetical protein